MPVSAVKLAVEAILTKMALLRIILLRLRSILNLEVTEQEVLALLEADHWHEKRAHQTRTTGEGYGRKIFLLDACTRDGLVNVPLEFSIHAQYSV